jgi:hypothetical protein
MALYVLQPGLQPLGQYDFLDADLTSVLGGELGVWGEASRTNTAAEKAAADALDGYVADQVDAGDGTATRPVLQLGDSGSTAAAAHYLLDDGSANYGTLYGELVGNPVGLATTGTALGPHSAQGSGKVTAWDKPGLYAVSTDALAADVLGGANLNDTPLPGELLYRAAATGRLTRTVSANLKAATFVELASDGSLVTTPGRLVGASEAFDRVVVQFLGATHNM